MSTPRMVLGSVAVAVTSFLSAACGDHVADRSVAVRTGYLAYWDSLLTASSVSDPDSTVLAEHAASRQLTLVKQNIAKSRELGLVAKGQVNHKIESVAVDTTTAQVTDCVDLDGWLQYDRHTGTLIQDQLQDRPAQLAIFTLASRNGGWVVTDNQVVGSC